MNKSRFDQQLKKYLSGELSAAEKKHFDAWLDSLGDDDKELMMSDTDQNALFDKIRAGIGEPEKIYTLEPRRAGQPMLKARTMVKIAAAVLLLLSASYVLWTSLRPKPEIVYGLASKEIEKMILPDGTIVWLKGQSKLIYFEKENSRERQVTLEGEALFEVAKEPHRPFIIHCGDLSATVLGTSFNLKSEKNHLELMVFTGKVSLSSPRDKEGIVILPNQKVIYQGTGPVEKIMLNGSEAAEMVANTDYDMRFNNATIDHIFHRIENKFDVKMNSDNSQVGACLITADFTDQSLDNTLKMIAEVLDLKYEIKDNHTVTIHGNGCH